MAYTYLIGWSKFNKWYYGVRFAKNCKPEDLWKTYFTSSNHVKKFREENGEPDIIQIRKIFDNSTLARAWESKVINRLKAIENPNWFNKTNNTDKFYHEGPRGTFSEEHRKKISEAHRGKKMSNEHREKLLHSRLGQKNSESHNQALRAGKLNYSYTNEVKKKMSDIKKNDPTHKERASLAGKIPAQKRPSNYSEIMSQKIKDWWKKRKEGVL